MSTSRRLTKKRTGTGSRVENAIAKSAISLPTLLYTDSALNITEYNAVPIHRDYPSHGMSRDRPFIHPGSPKKSRSIAMVPPSNKYIYSKDDIDIIYSTSHLLPQQLGSKSGPNTTEGPADVPTHTLDKR
jgi:hypothetical protein